MRVTSLLQHQEEKVQTSREKRVNSEHDRMLVF